MAEPGVVRSRRPRRHLAASVVASAVGEAGFLLSAIAYWFSQNLIVMSAVSVLWLTVLLVLLTVNRVVAFDVDTVTG